MSVAVKICGLTTADAVATAARHGAQYIGFVFYPPSRRNLTPEVAAALIGVAPPGITRVGLFVDAEDETLAAVLAKVPLDLLQFHGGESPERVAEVKRRFGKPVMKSIAIAGETIWPWRSAIAAAPTACSSTPSRPRTQSCPVATA